MRSLLLAGLLGGGFHGALERALKRVELIGRLLQQEAGHKLLQVGGLLIILSIKVRTEEEDKSVRGRNNKIKKRRREAVTGFTRARHSRVSKCPNHVC